MKRVIVTGAGGFIGRHTLMPLIHRGFDVHAITSKPIPIENQPWTWHQANLLDPLQVAQLLETLKPTHLLHFAWYAVPGKYWTSEENFRWVQGSLELLRQFQQQGGQRVVMAGTCAEYDWDYGYCSEFVTPKKPDSPYGICKNALQEMLNSYSKLTGLSSAWGRIFFVYGAYEHPNRLVASVIRSLLHQKPAQCSHGNQVRDFLYVQDAADAFVALLESHVTGPVNIASGQGTMLKTVIEKIADQLGRRDLIQLGAIKTNENESRYLVADIHRLAKEVGWHSTHTLEQGIQQTIDWWQSRIQTNLKHDN